MFIYLKYIFLNESKWSSPPESVSLIVLFYVLPSFNHDRIGRRHSSVTLGVMDSTIVIPKNSFLKPLATSYLLLWKGVVFINKNRYNK